MKAVAPIDRINIRPGVTILSVLRHLNYKPWFAIGEFVDNSIQSYLDNREELEAIEGAGFTLKVSIDFDPTERGRLIVRDNAAGIHAGDYARAFRPAEVPPDTSGLSEFGMGMKSAACWFASNWQVRTSALGELVENTVEFDIAAIVRDSLDELIVRPAPAQPQRHFTEIVLWNLHKSPQGRTTGKIKDHLASIYRDFIRKELLELQFDNEILAYDEPQILCAPHYKDLSATPVVWHKDIRFDLGGGLRARGFAALRETASVSRAGFALFRRGRLIQGSADEGYRPEFVFGKSNSYRYQRLFGELHLHGFEISHTKDGFRWDENEEPFLSLLKEHLNSGPLPLLDQAEGHRVRPKPDELKKGAEEATQRTADVIQSEVPPVLEKQLDETPEDTRPPADLPATTITTTVREIAVDLRGNKWLIHLEMTNDPAIGDWVEISDQQDDLATGIRRLGVRVSLAHPFMERFGGTGAEQIEPLLRVGAAICLAEIAARDAGVRMAGTIRRNINELLRDAFSKP